jgi:hypothetical protein
MSIEKTLLVFSILFIALILFFYLNNNLVSQSRFLIQNLKEEIPVDLILSEDYNYSFEINKTFEYIRSLSISGSYIGDGDVFIYLDDLLVADKSAILSAANINTSQNITAYAILNETTNETEIINETTVETEYFFENLCVSTCDLGTSFKEKNPVISFKISNATLKINKIKYDLIVNIQEENITENVTENITNVTNISNMTNVTNITNFTVSEGLESFEQTDSGIYYEKNVEIEGKGKLEIEIPKDLENIEVLEEGKQIAFDKIDKKVKIETSKKEIKIKGTIPNEKIIKFDKNSYSSPPGTFFEINFYVKNPLTKKQKMDLVLPFEKIEITEIYRNGVTIGFSDSPISADKLSKIKYRHPENFKTIGFSDNIDSEQTVNYKIIAKMPEEKGEGKFYFDILGDFVFSVDPWWNNNWQYRKQITITNSNSTTTLPSGYQINFTFDSQTLISGGKMMTNGSDARIAFQNTSGNYELDRANTSAFNSANTQLFFKTQAQISASGTDNRYYLYYGNPSAGDPPTNTSNIFQKIQSGSGTVGIWRMDEGSGNYLNDSSGNGYNGTLYNGTNICNGGDCPTWNGYDGGLVDNITSYNLTGDSLRFDGFNDYVDVGNNISLNINESLTVMAWIKFPSAVNYSRIASKHGSEGYGWTFGTNAYRLLFGFSTTGSDWNEWTGDTELSGLVWYHAAIVRNYSEGKVYFYLNGISDRTPATISGGIAITSTTAKIGKDGYCGGSGITGCPFNGTIDEVAIYNRSLSAEEIRYHYWRRMYFTPEATASLASETNQTCLYNSGTTTLAANLNCYDLNITNNATLVTNNYNITIENDLNLINGTFNMTGSYITVVRNWDSSPSAATLNKGTSTVNFTGTGSIKLRNNYQYNFYNLIVAQTGQTTTASTDIGNDGNLTIAGGNYTSSSYSHTMRQAGLMNFINNGIVDIDFQYYATSGTINVTSTKYGKNLYIASGAASSVTSRLTGNINVSQNLILYGSDWTGANTPLYTNNYTINVTNNFTIGNNPGIYGGASLNANNSTILVGGNIIVNDNPTFMNRSYINATNAIFYIGRNWNSSSTNESWNMGNSTIIFNGGTTQRIYTMWTNKSLPNVLIRNNSNVNLYSAVNLSGSFGDSLNNGTLNLGSYIMYVDKNWDSYSGSLTFTSGTSTVVFTGTGASRTQDGFNNAFNNLNITAGASRSSTTGNAFTSVTGLFFVNGTIVEGSWWQSYSNANPLIIGSAGNFSGGDYAACNQFNFTLPNGTYNGIALYMGNNYQAKLSGNTNITSAIEIYYNGWCGIGSGESILNTSGYNLTLGTISELDGRPGAIYSNGSWVNLKENAEISDISYINFGASNWNISKNFTSYSTSSSWNAGTANITFTGGRNQTVNFTSTNPANFYNVFINNNSNVTLNSNLNLSGSFGNGLDNGTINMQSYNLSIGGNWNSSSNNLTFTRGTSTVNFTGTGTINLKDETTNVFYNLAAGASGQTTTLNTNIATYNILTLGSGTLTGGAQHVHLWGANANRLVFGGTISGSLQVYYSSTADFNVAGGSYPSELTVESETNTATLQGNVVVGSVATIYGAWGSHSTTINTNNYNLTASQLILGILGESKPGILNTASSTVNITGSVNLYTASRINATSGKWTVGGNLTINPSTNLTLDNSNLTMGASGNNIILISGNLTTQNSTLQFNQNNYGLYINSSNTSITNITLLNASLWDIYFNNSNMIHYNVSFGGTVVTYSGYNVSMKNVTNPPDTSGYTNVSKYLNVSNTSSSSSILLNISYTESPSCESNLKIYKYTGSDWTAESQTEVNTTAKYVWANITPASASVYAPLCPSDTNPPSVVWVDPTPPNGNTTSNNWVYLNTTITDASNTSAFLDWNYSLVGYWAMDWYNSTGIFDNSTYNNFGTFQGGLSTSNITTGKYGKGLKFDGVDDLVDINYSASLNLVENFTVTAWAQNHKSIWRNGVLTTRWNYNTGGQIYFSMGIAFVRGGYIVLGNGTDTLLNDEISNSHAYDQWHYLAVTVNRFNATHSTATMYFYSPSGTTANRTWIFAGFPIFTEAQSTSPSVKIAKGVEWDPTGNVSVDEVHIWNRTLSEQEINASYNNGLYRLYNNFTNLANGAYNYSAYAIDTYGNMNISDRTGNLLTRTVTILAGNCTGSDPYTGGNWTVSGNTVCNGQQFTVNGYLNITNTGNLTLTNSTNLTINTDVILDGNLTAGDSIVKVARNWNSTLGNFSRGTSTVNLTGTGNISVKQDSAQGFYNLVAAPAGQTTTAYSTAYTWNTFTTGSGTYTTAVGTVNMQMWGSNPNPFVNGGGPMWLTLYFVPSVDYNIPAGTNYNRITIDGNGGYKVATLQGNIQTDSHITVGWWGRLKTNNYNITMIGGILYIGISCGYLNYLEAGSSTINITSTTDYVFICTNAYILGNTSTWYVGRNWLSSSTSSSMDMGTSTVIFNGVNQNISVATTSPASFYNLKIRNNANTSLISNLNLSGSFGNGADNGTINIQSYNMSVGENWNSSSSSLTFNSGNNSTVNLRGTGNFSFFNYQNFYNLIVANPGKTTTMPGTSYKWLVVNAKFTIAGGNLSQGVHLIGTNSAGYSNTDPFEFVPGSNWTASGGLYIGCYGYGSPPPCPVRAITYPASLTVSWADGGGPEFFLEGNTNVTGGLAISSGTALTTNNYNITANNIELWYRINANNSIINVTDHVYFRESYSVFNGGTSTWYVGGYWDSRSTSSDWNPGTSKIIFNSGNQQNVTITNRTATPFYDVELRNLGTRLYLKNDTQIRNINISSETELRMDSVSEAKNLTLYFTDASGAGFDSTSSGNLTTIGSQAYWPKLTTNATGAPTNYWNGWGGSKKIIADYSIFEYFGSFGVQWNGLANVNNSIIRHFTNNGFIMAAGPMVSFVNNTLDDGGWGIVVDSGYGGNYANFDNITIQNMANKDIHPTNAGVELNNSNFNVQNIADVPNRVISKNHNDVPNDYKIIMGNDYSLSKSQITNDFSPSDNVEIVRSTLMIDEAAQSSNFTIDAGAHLNITNNNLTITAGENNKILVNGNITLKNSVLQFNQNSYGLYVNSSNTSINNLTLLNASVWDVYLDNSNLSASNISFGGTLVTFNGYNFSMKNVSDIPPASGFYNLSKALNVSSTSSNSNVYLNFSYEGSPEGENDLKIYRWTGSAWTPESNTGVDTSRKVVWAIITPSSIYAPLAQIPGGETPGGGGVSGGGSMGGGLNITRNVTPPKIFIVFSISPESLSVELPKDGAIEKSIVVTNIGNHTITITIDSSNLKDNLVLPLQSFSLNQNETKETKFTVLAGSTLGIKTGTLIMRTGEQTTELPIVISVSSERVLFDAKIDIPPEYKEIQAGNDLKTLVTLLPVGSFNRTVDVIVTYLIKDFDDKTITTETETFAVSEQTSFTKIFKLPSDLKTGSYVAGIEVLYENSFATSAAMFNVVSPKIPDIWIVAFIAIVVVALFSFYNFEIRKRGKVISRKAKTFKRHK